MRMMDVWIWFHISNDLYLWFLHICSGFEYEIIDEQIFKKGLPTYQKIWTCLKSFTLLLFFL